MPVVYSECVLKVGDSGHFSSWLSADILTIATNKRMHNSDYNWRIKGSQRIENQSKVLTNVS